MKKGTRKFLGFAALTSAAAGSIFLANHIIHMSAVVKDLLHRSSAHFYNWRFGRIHYTKQGNGSPLLLVHDLTPCSSTHEWDSLIETLAQDHTVYCIDLLGCGCSDRPRITYTNYLYVQLLTDFIRSVIGQKTDIVVSGLSGSFVLMANHADSTIINKIIMINPADLAVMTQIPDWKSRLFKKFIELPLIGTFFYNLLMTRSNIDLLFTEKYLYNPFQPDGDWMDYAHESAHLNHENGKYLFASLHGNYVYCNIARILKSVSNDLYILEGAGEEDAKENVALYTSLHPSITAKLLPHTRHLPHLEAPDKVLSILADFLE